MLTVTPLTALLDAIPIHIVDSPNKHKAYSDKIMVKNQYHYVEMRPCMQCNEMMINPNPQRKYCSGKCRKRASRDRAKPHCLHCGQVLQNRQRMWCGLNCRVNGYRAKRSATIQQFLAMGIPEDTVLETLEIKGTRASFKTLERLNKTYSYTDRCWVG